MSHPLHPLSAPFSKIVRFSSFYLGLQSIIYPCPRALAFATAGTRSPTGIHSRLFSTPATRLNAIDGRPLPLTHLDLHPATPLSDIARLMRSTGHYKWGFTIYRTTYEEEELWNSFLVTLRQSAQESLKYWGPLVRLGPFLTWTVIQDPAGLNHASRATVRSHFQGWIQGVSSARDGEGAERARDREAPQYTYCLVVDANCLEQYRAIRDSSEPSKSDHVPVVVVPAYWNADDYDGRWIPEVDDEEDGKYFDFPKVEGSTSPILDWMLAEQSYLVILYNDLLKFGWYETYARPPRVYPDDADDKWKIRG